MFRKLYEAQSHSTAGIIEWDWDKFDLQPGPGIGESSSDCFIVPGTTNDVKAVHVTTDHVPATDEIEAKTQVRRLEFVLKYPKRSSCKHIVYKFGGQRRQLYEHRELRYFHLTF